MVRRNWKRASDGGVIVNGKKFATLVGSRAQVWHGTAYKTNPGKKALTRKHLMQKKMVKLSLEKRAKLQKDKSILANILTLLAEERERNFKK